MKKLMTALALILLTGLTVQAQELSKEETLKYIEMVYKGAYKNENGVKVESVVLEPLTGVLMFTYSTGNTYREDIRNCNKFNISSEPSSSGYGIECDDIFVVGRIAAKSDAERLVNAFTHLSKLLKLEKETDPFAPKE